MSEPDGNVMIQDVDATPPPDIIEQPARSRGAYKLCMECGQNVLRFEYRAGSSICKACEARPHAVAVDSAGNLLMQDGVQRTGEAIAVPPDEDEAALPLELPAGAAVAGTLEARDWLAVMCGLRSPETLTLDAIAAELRSLREQQVEMIGRVTRYGTQASPLTPEAIPLETAAQTLWLACDPVVQERLTAACEVLRLSLNQVILGNLAYHEQDLLDQDPSLVPQASYAAQFGTGAGRTAPGRQGAPGRTGLPGGRLVDAQGLLVKDCLCCGREFHPQPARPNPDFCDEACGTFVDQLRIWATNTVLDEMRYPDSATRASQPDPRTYWTVDRCQEPYLSHALQFRESRVTQQMEAAHQQQQKMRGL